MAPEARSPSARTALVYVPGLEGIGPAQSADVIARKVVAALERASPSPVAFGTREGKDEEYGQEAPRAKTRVRTIVRSGGGAETPLLDVYELEYGPQLRSRFEGRILLLQIIQLLWTLVASVPRHVAALGRRSKSAAHKLQMIWVSAILVILASYTGVLLYGLWLGAASLAAPDRARPVASLAGGTPQPAEPAGGKGRGRVDAAVVRAILILGGLGALSRESAKELLRKVAVEYVCALSYLRAGERRAALSGQLLALLDHVGEKTPPYEQVHVLGYSFGSVVSLDALFDENPPAARLERFGTLVTVGCPFDLIRSYWPGYFADRRARLPDEAKWINVYAPNDVLGSNFRDDARDEPATEGISCGPGGGRLVPENVVHRRGGTGAGAVEALLLGGFRAHKTYWDPDDPNEVSCFDQLATRLVVT